MCGLLFVSNSKYSEKDFLSALKTMAHRGPNNLEHRLIKRHFLGHVRLSILDLDKRSNQPFSIGDFTLIYNGEIYNYKELIKEHNLETTTSSDTEVLLRLYIKYGKNCLDFLNGMFAFVVVNNKTGEFFAARDRLGVKPLYYREINGSVIIASEIASILELEPSKLDEFGLRQYRKLRMTIKGHTTYEQVKFFPPGCYFDGASFTRYWDLNCERKKAPTDDELEHLIVDAVEIRKRSDVPVGSYLSGGLDSTILSALLKPSHTWTVGFESLNEFEWANIANSVIGSSHSQTKVTYAEFLETARFMVKKRREPLSVPNEVLLYLMTKVVSKKNTVVFSGEGADELFWGYDRIFRWANQLESEVTISEFDKYYCYGSNVDNEVIDFALENLPGQKALDKVGYYFQIHHLQGLLRRLDNSTMLCGVEGRVPFVDFRLVEMMAGTPFDWRMGQSFKEPLKRVFKDIVPEEIVNRKKIGFPVPLNDIFNVEAEDSMDAWLAFNLSELGAPKLVDLK